MENKENNQFNYTYAAPTDRERREIESVRAQYLPSSQKSEDALTRLKPLDKRVQNIPLAVSLTLGVVGTLIFGLGLSMILEFDMRVFGAIVAVVGLIPLALAHPAHTIILKKCKAKYGKEILALSAKLLGEESND